jgi:hypothetical protein
MPSYLIFEKYVTHFNSLLGATRKCHSCTPQNHHVNLKVSENKECCSSIDNYALAGVLMNMWMGKIDLYHKIQSEPSFNTKQKFMEAVSSSVYKVSTHPEMPTAIKESIYDMILPESSNRPCDLRKLLSAIRSSASDHKIDLSYIDAKSSFINKSGRGERFLLEGLSMLELSYSMVDRDMKTSSLAAAMRAFKLLLDDPEEFEINVAPDGSPTKTNTYHLSLVRNAHAQLATVYFVIVRFIVIILLKPFKVY